MLLRTLGILPRGLMAGNYISVEGNPQENQKAIQRKKRRRTERGIELWRVILNIKEGYMKWIGEIQDDEC